MFLGQAGMFLSFQAGRSSATRSSTSDLTRETLVQDPKWLRWLTSCLPQIRLDHRHGASYSPPIQLPPSFFDPVLQLLLWISNSQPSWDTLPFSKPQNLPRVEVWQHWRGFSLCEKWICNLSKRVVVAHWDRQNDSLLRDQEIQSPLEWCSCKKGLQLRPSCKTPRWAITHVERLGMLHQAPSFVLCGLDKASSWAEGSLTAGLSDPGTLSVLPPSWWFLGTLVWHLNEQFQVDWNVLQFNSYQLTCANRRIVQGASRGLWGQHPPCWKPIGFHRPWVFCTKVTRPHGLQTKAFSIL